MTVLEIFLVMLDHAGGRVRGKTLIQKRAFFLNRALNLGLRYKPHYYGPYSPDLDSAIGQAKALGFVEQNIIGFGFDGETGFEVKRFDFTLTPDGKEVVQDLKSRQAKECRGIQEVLDKMHMAGDENYVSLSVAAKTIHILSQKDEPLTQKDIITEAKQFGWEISERNMEMAVDFMKNLGLIKNS